ncbi:hypothetical protein I317_07671 [Kwoniella heveanensis CBS 569]|nr:hypothetical protein I317_07671 [Kwoniella heveanensis CBS 569]
MPYVKPKRPSSPPRPGTPLPPPFVPSDYSPPASPVSTIPPPTDDESDLSDSWLEVEEQSSAGRSSVGPSVLGDVAFSDTSSDSHENENGQDLDHDHETPSHWSDGSDGGDGSERGDNPGDLTIAPDPSSILSPSLAGGEYTDAEASISRLDSSVGTIHRDGDMASPSSSQIRLIFPDPGASFSTSSGTLSAGFTPTASIAGLTPMAHLDHPQLSRAGAPATPAITTLHQPRGSSRPSGRGVDDTWLRSTKLWTPAPEVDQSITTDHYEYQLLGSVDDVDHIEQDLTLVHEGEQLQIPKVDVTPSQSHVGAAATFPGASKNMTNKNFPVNFDGKKAEEIPEVLALGQILNTDALAQSKTGTKKWSTGMSILALASVLSLALFRSFGPSSLISAVTQQTQEQAAAPATFTTPASTEKPSSIWDTLPFLPISLATTSALAASSPTAKQPELQVIKQALSTLSTLQDRLSSAANRASKTDPTVMKDEAPIMPQDQNLRTSTSCCSVSIRDDQVALTSRVSVTEKHTSLARKLTEKLLGVNRTAETAVNVSTAGVNPSPNCTCSLSTYFQSQVLARIAATFVSTRYYTLTTAQYLGHIFGPILASIEQEISVLANLTRLYTSAALSTSRSSLFQAAQGAAIIHERINHTMRRATDGISSYFTARNSGQQAQDSASAQDLLDSLSEYVETRLDGLSDMIADEAQAMQERGWDCIYQAKSGLDKLISDIKKLHPKSDKSGNEATSKAVSAAEAQVDKDGPLPFAHMEVHPPVARLGRRGRTAVQDRSGTRARGSARRERRQERRYVERKLRGKKVNVIVPPIPAPEKPSRAKRVMDLVHHVSVTSLLNVVC